MYAEPKQAPAQRQKVSAEFACLGKLVREQET